MKINGLVMFCFIVNYVLNVKRYVKLFSFCFLFFVVFFSFFFCSFVTQIYFHFCIFAQS